MDLLRSKPGKGPVELNIFLPERQISPGMEWKVKKVLILHWDRMLKENARRHRAARIEAPRSLWIGGIFSILCVLFGVCIYLAFHLSETLLGVLTGVFSIFVWMALWNPAEQFLYGLRHYKLDEQVYRALKDAKVSIAKE